MDNNFSNKQIARNTLLLYVRQVLTIIVSLYTSRVVLNTLGVDDFGIYNVVGGIVLMFSFITSTMASASQRYLSYDMAKDDDIRLSQTFSLILISYIIISILAFVVCESLAVWFLNTKMNIPEGRLNAANWVLQFSIFTFVANLLSTPYMSVVIAREKMDVYAYASICDVVLKLAVVYVLLIFDVDKLKLYAVLMFVASSLITLFYATYCVKKFNESRFKFYFDLSRIKEMFAFAWWNVFGALANVLRSQGINILLNIFFSPSVNAARGIAYNVNSAISNFSNNFYTAVRPQIIKRYAAGTYNEMYSLVYSSSKLAYFLMLIISVPILFETDIVMKIWLKTPPDLASLFVQLIIINSLLEVLNYPLVNAIQATGKIKTYQIIVSGFYLLNLPISYVMLRNGFPPETTMYVNLILLLICFLPRLIICKKVVDLDIARYVKVVIVRIVLVTIVSLSLNCLIHNCNYIQHQYGNAAIKIFVMIIITFTGVVMIGLDRNERTNLYKLLVNKLKK